MNQDGWPHHNLKICRVNLKYVGSVSSLRLVLKPYNAIGGGREGGRREGGREGGREEGRRGKARGRRMLLACSSHATCSFGYMLIGREEASVIILGEYKLGERVYA